MEITQHMVKDIIACKIRKLKVKKRIVYSRDIVIYDEEDNRFRINLFSEDKKKLEIHDNSNFYV